MHGASHPFPDTHLKPFDEAGLELPEGDPSTVPHPPAVGSRTEDVKFRIGDRVFEHRLQVHGVVMAALAVMV